MAPSFTSADVAALAEVPVGTLLAWFDREHFIFSEDDQDATRGRSRRISPNTAVAVCIAAKLTKLDAKISRAAYAGMAFAHTTIGHPTRAHPAAIYPGSVATALALGEGQHVTIFPVGARPIDNPGFDLLVHIGAGATVLRVDPIVRKIEEAAADG